MSQNKNDFKGCIFTTCFEYFFFSLTYKLRDLSDWVRDRSVTSEERKAFFINLYNCLMIDALAECSVPKSGDEGPEQNLPVSPLKVNIVLRFI